MKILLINNNPVVSRLTALSARKEDIEIDEIQEVTELSSDTYDIVFVDGDSWTKDVRDVITENMKVKKSVLFYTEGDEDEKESFDLTILKPFLPSEVSAVIRSVEEVNDTVEENESQESHFDILADAKASSREELFSLDGLEDKVAAETVPEPIMKEEELSLDLTDNDNLLSEKDNFDTKLEEAFPLKINTLDDDLLDDEIEMKEELISNEELFELDMENEEKLSLDDALEDELFSDDKTEKVNNDEVLDFDLDSDEVKLEEVTTPATQILDESEIENIKGLLNEEPTDDISLDDIMPPMQAEEIETKAPKKKSSKKSKDSMGLEANVLLETMKSLPVENLRELLAGAKIDISIRFPKAK